MGLAASQAKLLSLTCRLSDNEMRTQSLTAAKMALASQSSAASRKYIDALDANKFIYRTYDDAGNKVYTALTGAQLTTYSPIKNQYGIINTKGQILVSELDAANYEDSGDINEFLAHYGIDPIPTGKTHTIENPAYAEAYEEWEKAYTEWKEREPDQYIKELVKPAWDEEVADDDNELYQIFRKASFPCHNNAMHGTADCYKHVLGHCLYLQLDSAGRFDYSKYPIPITTTTGDSTKILAEDHDWSAIYASGLTPSMKYVSESICDNYKGKTLMATADSKYVSRFDLTEADKTGDMSDPEYKKRRLLSNYTIDSSGNIVLKTLEQKCIDMYYLIEHYGEMGIPYDPDMKDLILSFEEDMRLAGTQTIHHPDEWNIEKNPEYEKWLEEEPEPISVPATIDEPVYEYSDKDKAQWYVNLWHRMNGPSAEKDGVETVSETTSYTEVTSNGTKTTTNTEKVTRNRWDILEDGLMNSQDWLKYALETGTVSLERVNFTNPTEEGSGLKFGTWTSIQYNNALDISEQTDEAAIAKAEAEYQQKTREIENKDKQIDSMIKLLDTEHSALQTEYESVKSVITKNTERTLKIYSA